MYLQAQTPKEINEVRAMKKKVAVKDAEENMIVRDVDLISAEFRAMVDCLCFTGSYGNKTMLEARTRATFRESFFDYALKVVNDRVEEF